MSLGDLVVAVFDMRAEMRSAGADSCEIDAATERSLRSAWPSGRVWKYVCQHCQDYGLEMFWCPGDRTCGRDRPHLAHECGRACSCSRGARYRPRVKSDADFAEAGKVTKPRSMSKFGR